MTNLISGRPAWRGTFFLKNLLILLLVAGSQWVFAQDGSVNENNQYKLSGSWYDPNRNGEGFHIEILEDGLALAIWFTYPGSSDNQATNQSWILGTGTIAGNVITIKGAYKAKGPVFGPDYDKDDLNIVSWGDVTLTFTDLETLVVDYDGNDGAGTINMVRLTSLAEPGTVSTLPPEVSGAWYDPGTNGQGWFVEILSPSQALVYMFTFDENGNQAWSLAGGKIIGRKIIVGEALAGTGTGFGDAFNINNVSLDPIGAIVLDFESCANGTVNYFYLADASTASLPLERLTRLKGYACEGALPEPDISQLTMMSNPSDPAIERYSGWGGTEIETYGTSDEDGGNVAVSGALVTLPDGRLIRIKHDKEAGIYEMTHTESGTRIRIQLDESGNRIVTIISAGEDHILSGVLPAEEEAQSQSLMKEKPSNSEVNSAGKSKTQATNQAGQKATVKVDYCNAPTSFADVDLIVGDRSIPQANPTNNKFIPKFALIVPTVVTGSDGSWVYEGRIPTEQTEFQPSQLAKRCNLINPQVLSQCLLNTSLTNQYGSYCAEITKGVFPPSFGMSSYVQCFVSQAAAEEHCAWFKFRDAYTCPLNFTSSIFTEFRLPREDFWAEVWMSKVTEESVHAGPTAVSLNATEYATIQVDLGDGDPTILGASTIPALVTAGSNYQGEVVLTCVEPGSMLTASRSDSTDVFTCSVDDEGSCKFAVSAAKDSRQTDSFVVSGPEGLSTTLSVQLFPPVLDVNHDLTGSWFVKSLSDETDCGDGFGFVDFTAAVTQFANGDLQVCSQGLCLDGKINGSAVNWAGSYPEDGGTTTTSARMTLSGDGNTMNGSADWAWSDGSFSCTGDSVITATRN